MLYKCQAPIDKWIFLVVQLSYDLADTVTLAMYVTEDQLGPAASTDSKTVTSEQGLSKVSLQPFFVNMLLNAHVKPT